MQVPIWNPTIANLTLLALGSSAPEILLKDLGKPAGVLGPASIVGSGAFNLLVITGISILSVDEPKKIYDLGVYACTASFSLFAYSWMYFCLLINTENVVDINEAWLTLFFFFLLVSVSFAADKYQ
jgi:solute carrier family 8 (sodium/calcium exchanger)